MPTDRRADVVFTCEGLLKALGRQSSEISCDVSQRKQKPRDVVGFMKRSESKIILPTERGDPSFGLVTMELECLEQQCRYPTKALVLQRLGHGICLITKTL
ncbi:hypothetical protein RLEG12_08995 (plasmid) [Rhizobium leguminosarum bv. trifolii CB782]|nr:hypothetical protein RLEG12_08995 [Rhizobium leguminosarum bv. trifolii CB782]